MRRHYLIISIICFIIGAYTLTLLSASGTPSTLVVRTDANNYLLVTSVTQTNPVTQGVFTSRILRTDSSGSLQVVLTGTVTPTYPMSIPASTCAAPSLGESGAATTGIAFTATPSILMCIAGTAMGTWSNAGLTGSTSATFSIQSGISQNLVINAAGAASISLRTNNTEGLVLGQSRQLTHTVATLTTDIKVLDAAVTWNAAGVTFTGWKLNVTDTASAAASLLMDLQVGAASKFSLTKAGLLTTITATVTSGANLNNIGIGSGHGTMNARFTSAGAALVTLADNAGTSGSVLEFLEQTVPSAGAANTARIYAVDNGSGKTQVCALFSSGAAQCFATQP